MKTILTSLLLAIIIVFSFEPALTDEGTPPPDQITHKGSFSTWTSSRYGTLTFHKESVIYHPNGRLKKGKLSRKHTITINEAAYEVNQIELNSYGEIRSIRLAKRSTWTNGDQGRFIFSSTHPLFFHSNGVVSKGKLSVQSTWVNGENGKFVFTRNSIITFYPDGRVIKGRLGSFSEWFNPIHGSFLFKNNEDILFYSNGVVEAGTISRDKVWTNGTHGTFILKHSHKMHFHPNGEIHGGQLAQQAAWTNGKQGVFWFKADASIFFYPNGSLRSGTLENDNAAWTNGTYGNFMFAGFTPITFYSNGNVRTGILRSDATWTDSAGKKFHFQNNLRGSHFRGSSGSRIHRRGRGGRFHLHPNGVVKAGILSKNMEVIINNVRYTFASSHLIGLHPNEAVIQGYVVDEYIRLYAHDGTVASRGPKWDPEWTGDIDTDTDTK